MTYIASDIDRYFVDTYLTNIEIILQLFNFFIKYLRVTSRIFILKNIKGMV